MKILFMTAWSEIVASSRTRVFQYLPFFAQNKVTFKLITHSCSYQHTIPDLFLKDNVISRIFRKLYYKTGQGYDFIYSFVNVMRFMSLAAFYDIIFIQKVLLPNFSIKLLKEVYRKKIVFDFDDAIYTKTEGYNKRRFDFQIPLFDLVVLENPFTKAYVNDLGNNNTLTITGPIECNLYRPKIRQPRSKVVVGWIGSFSTTEYLNILKNVFRKLAVTYENLVFELIGAQRINLDLTNVVVKKWSLDTEIADLQNFDIGIMPLPENEWTRGKGGYKLLQYMAVGIPCVASPVGINKELIKEGESGFLADTEEEWFEKLSLLIENYDLRKNMGAKGRNFVVRNYSLESAAPKLITAMRHLA